MKSSQLRRIARETLTPALAGESFVLAKGRFTYWRRKEDIFQVILCDFNRAGDHLKIFIVLWVPESAPYYDMGNFPAGLPMTAFRGLTRKGLDWYPGAVWNVSDEDQARTTLAELSATLFQIAIPWFDERTTRAALVEALQPEYRQDQGRVDRILHPPNQPAEV